MKSDEDKIRALGPYLAMAYSGEPGDTDKLTDYVERNLRLYQIRWVCGPRFSFMPCLHCLGPTYWTLASLS